MSNFYFRHWPSAHSMLYAWLCLMNEHDGERLPSSLRLLQDSGRVRLPDTEIVGRHLRGEYRVSCHITLVSKQTESGGLPKQALPRIPGQCSIDCFSQDQRTELLPAITEQDFAKLVLKHMLELRCCVACALSYSSYDIVIFSWQTQVCCCAASASTWAKVSC